MYSNHQQLICITGSDGSGKSTLIEHLLMQFPKAVECTIWAALADPDIRLFSSKQSVDDYLCMLTPHARSLFLAHALLFSIEKALKTGAQHIFINAHYYKYFASELCLGADQKLITELITIFPKVHKTIFLNLSPEKAAERKIKFSRYECGCIQAGPAPFISFQNRCNPYLKEFIQPGWLLLNAAEQPGELFKKSIEFILQE